MPETALQPPSVLGDLLEQTAVRFPDDDAVVVGAHRLSYADLLARSRRWAAALRAAGIRPGEHVGLLLPTCCEFIEAFFGAAMIGAATVPVNARYAPKELSYVLENADIVTLVTVDRVADAVDFTQRLYEAFPDLSSSTTSAALHLAGAPKLRNIVVCGSEAPAGLVAADELFASVEGMRIDDVGDSSSDAGSLGDGSSGDDAPGNGFRARPGDPAIILYTSGTTSNPKGCLISHRAIIANARALGRSRYELTHEDRFWSPLPIFHIAGLLPLVAIVDVGGAYLTASHFDAGEALDMLERERATVAYPCFVTIMQDLIGHPRFRETDLSRIRLMNSNLAVQPAHLRDALARAMPNALQVGTYGLSEASGTVTTSRLSDGYVDRTSRLGVPLAGWEVRIVDPVTKHPCPAGVKGELLARGPGLLTGYYKDADKTAEALDAEGWLHTGDICSIDANGQVMFHGRLKDMLKVGGENVAAAEIEAVLNSHLAVKLAQVVGAHDERYAEVPAAFIELREGARVAEADLIAYCDGKIARFKKPRYIRFVSEWPMSTSKVKKFELQQRINAELAGKGTIEPGR